MKPIDRHESLTGAMILAAGEGKRFGGPKALGRLEGKSWLRIAYDLLCEAGADTVAIVLGADARRVRSECGVDESEHLAAVKPVWIVNEKWQAGRTGSIQCGLSCFGAQIDTVLIHQVDFPFVQSQTIRALFQKFAKNKSGSNGENKTADRIHLPRFKGRNGHPILISRGIWPEINSLGPDDPLSIVVSSLPERIDIVEVEDDGIHRNRNTRDDRNR